MTDVEETSADIPNKVENEKGSNEGRPYGSNNFRSRSCYNCGQIGHLSYDCYRGRGGGNGFRSRPQRCYNCQKEGHISRDCTNPPGAKSCYNCGAEGHISRDCSEPRKERPKNCFNCNEPGHIAAQCPTRT